MLKEERLDFILQKLKSDQKVKLGELSEALQVSEDTVRRDIELLASNGLLTKVRGGAIPHSPNLHNFKDRIHELEEDKNRIARKALQLLQPYQTVMLGGGTTVYALARMLPHDLPLTVVTNNVPLATLLCDHPAVDLVLAGGRVQKDSQVTLGHEAINMFKQVHVDVCIIGICSVHHEIGITIKDYNETEVVRAMMHSAGRVIAVTTYNKIGTAELYKVGDITAVETIITEADNNMELFAPYQQLGINIL